MERTKKIMVAGPQEDPHFVVAGCVEAMQRLGVESLVSLNEADVTQCDGLILPGGLPDVDPSLYGEELAGSTNVDAELDRIQMGILTRAVKMGKPILGICRGSQILNVFFGGTLIQDIAHAEMHKYIEDTELTHDVDNVVGSWTEKLYGPHIRVNTKHHQAVGKLASCMRPAQIWFSEEMSLPQRKEILCAEKSEWVVPEDESFLIESFQHRSLPIVAVQWHPELMVHNPLPGTGDPMPIFQYFNSLLSAADK